MPAVFISYSRRDKSFVERLHDALKSREYDVWVDWEDIPPSAEWFEEIRSGVRSADGFIYVISPDSVSSEVCTRELGNAVDQRKRIVPVVCREPDGRAVPEAAAALNWVFLRTEDDFDAGFAQLVSALETDLNHVRTHTRLGVAAARWESSGHDKSLLLRGSDLATAEAWLVAGAGKQPEATQLHRQYVLSSRQAATRRQRTTIGAVSVALGVAIALAIVALVQRSTAIHERNVAYSRQLDANAQNQYGTDPELSVLLAAKAATVAPGSPTEEALREALAQSHVRVRYRLASVGAGDALWSPDGTRLLVTSPGAWSRIYRPGSGTPPVSMPGPSSLDQSGWDAAGNRVVIGGGHPGVYDASTGRLIAEVPGGALYAALSGDGTRVVTVDVHSIGHVFDVATGRELASFTPRDRGGTTCFALSPDGTVAAQCDAESLSSLSGNTPSALDTWDTRTGRLIRSVAAPVLISSVAFSPDSRQYVFTISGTAEKGVTAKALAAAEGQAGTFVYDVRGAGAPVITFPGAASDASFSPNAQFPAVAYATVGDDTGNVYSFLSHQTKQLTGAGDVIGAIRFDSSGGYVVEADDDGTARVFNASTGGPAIEVLAGHTQRVREASFGMGDTAVATSSEDGTSRVWTGPIPRPALRLADTPVATSISFSADGRRIIEAGEGPKPSGRGRVLDARNLRTLVSFAAPAGQVFVGAAASHDGRLITALTGPSAFDPVAVDAYDAQTGRLLATMTPAHGLGPINGVLDDAGDKLVTFGPGAQADEWNPHTGSLLHDLSSGTLAAAAAFSKDGSQVAIAHYPKLPPPSHVTFATTFGPITVAVWNARTGGLERTLTGDTLQWQIPGEASYAPLTLAFSPDGKLLAVSGADSTVALFDPHTGRLVTERSLAGELGGAGFAASLAFSPDGKVLAAGVLNGALLWRVPSFTPLGVFQQVAAGSAFAPFLDGSNGVFVGFTNDSNDLAMVGDDALEAWDIASHVQLFSTSPIERGRMSPEATGFVTASGAGVSVYPCDLCGGLPHLLTLAKRDTTRSFDAAERAQYLTQG